MKKRIGSLLAAIILIAIIAFLAVDVGYSLYNPDRLTLTSPFCVLDVIRGEVFVMEKDSLSWEKAEDGMMLETGSRIKTAPDAQASVTFTKGTTSKLEAGTDVIVDKIEYGEGAQPYSVVLKQQSGKTWNQVDKTAGNTSFRIRTESADIKVRGTLFATEVDEAGRTKVQTTEGSVSVSAGGEEVRVLAGKMTEVEPGGKPAAPVAMPRPKNELVITVNNQAFGLVKDPGGSSIGYLNSGTKVNQISGSSVTIGEESVQTIRLREPESGEYTLTLRGVADGTGEVSVEGFVDGQRAFLSVESCNITAAQETLVKLHYDVIAGLLQQAPSDYDLPGGNAALAAQLPGETAEEEEPAQTKPAPAAPAGAEKLADKGFTWFDMGNAGMIGRVVTITVFLLMIAVIFVFMRKNN